MKNILSFFTAFSLLVFLALPAVAADGKAPSRESLVSYWEKKTQEDKDVGTFKKTDEKGVYKFETSFFPYKGRLKLLNAAITKSSDSYYADIYTGIIEVELLDAKENFFRKYAASYGAWTAQNYFYYDTKAGVWFPSSEWASHFSGSETSAASARSCPLGGQTKNILLLLVLAAFVGLLAVFVKKQNKKIWDNHAKALEEQKRGLKLAEESLEHQKEHTKLLKEILSALSKKK